MSDIFCNVLDISMKGSIAIVIVMLLRFALKGRMKSAFVYMMWGIVLFRLLVPVNIESVYSIFNVVSVPETAVEFNIEPYVGPTESVDVINQINGNGIDITEETPRGDIFSKIWSAGVVIFILWFAVVFTRFKNRLVCGERFMKYRGKYDVHVCSGIGSPMISGIVRPRILIPDDLTLNEAELSYILDHEVMHIRKRDYLLKPLTLMTVCIHWFNPLVWIGYFIAMKDMELSCDERVLESYDDESYPMYADTLLKMSMHQNNMRLSAMVAFGENNVKSRVVSALKFKKLSRTVKIIGILMILVLSIVLITNGNTESRILKSLNEGFSLRTSQEITKNDIFQIVKTDNEYVVFHTVFSDEEGRYIYAVSEVERSGFSYFYSGGYSNSTNFEVVDKPYMGDVSIYKTEIGRMVAGIYVGEEPDRVEVNGATVELDSAGSDIYFWYGFMEDGDLNIEVYGTDGEILCTYEKKYRDNPFEIIGKKRGLSAEVIKERTIAVADTEFGILVNYWSEDGKAVVSEWLEYTEDSFVFMGYAENPISLINEDDSSVVVFRRFIFGLTKADVENVKITKGLEYSSNPLIAETVLGEDGIVLWYQLLTDEFMDRQEIVIKKKDGLFFFLSTGVEASSEKEIVNFTHDDMMDFIHKFVEAERTKDFVYLKSVSTEEFYKKIESEEVLLNENVVSMVSINVVESDESGMTVIVTVVMNDTTYGYEHVRLVFVDGNWLVDGLERDT